MTPLLRIWIVICFVVAKKTKKEIVVTTYDFLISKPIE